MRRIISFQGSVSPLIYALVAPLLLLSQNLMVALCYRWLVVPWVARAIVAIVSVIALFAFLGTR